MATSVIEPPAGVPNSGLLPHDLALTQEGEASVSATLTGTQKGEGKEEQQEEVAATISVAPPAVSVPTHSDIQNQEGEGRKHGLDSGVGGVWDDVPEPEWDQNQERVTQTTNPERQRAPFRVEVTWHDFDHFKNRYSPTEGLAIIEVLRGHSGIVKEFLAEEDMRKDFPNTRKAPSTTSAATDGKSWAQRIRIQSPELLTLLSRLTGFEDSWPVNRPRVFFSPFRAFYYFLPQMRECHRILKEHGASHGEAANVPTDSTVEPRLAQENRDDALKPKETPRDRGKWGTPMDPVSAVSGDLLNSFTALLHVGKYIEFVEEHIVPHWEHAAGTSKRWIRFDELWMSFKPGELLHIVPEGDKAEHVIARDRLWKRSEIYHRTWRLYALELSCVSNHSPNDLWPDEENGNSANWLELHCYFIDFDGTSYVPVRNSFRIPSYQGERDITSYDLYPMRFARDADKTTSDLANKGAWFCQALRLKHLRYEGWTLTRGPVQEATGYDTRNNAWTFDIKPTPRQYVDDNVMIDFAEGFNSERTVGPDPSTWLQGFRDWFDDSNWKDGDDTMFIKHWKTSAAGEFVCVGYTEETTQRSEQYSEKMTADQQSSSPVLQAHKVGKILTELGKEDCVLLPQRVVAYTFRDRKFVLLDCQFLKPLLVAEDAFKDLRIDDQHKRIVKSLVKTHLRKHAGQRESPNSISGQDLIRGKGDGLFILLHGVPGVGKTATAEAVAQASKKPLFPITCGDIGTSPQVVSATLTSIFRLAHKWDAILLLDEADVFLSRRELGDLERNALVTVFLRVLEYYSGILFLTTNRVGTMDEAFKSRIHLSLYYPPLTLERTLSIFEVNIRRLRALEAGRNTAMDANPDLPKRSRLSINDNSILDYAKWHFEENEFTPEQRWNGRQIRNAFQLAYSLAHFDMETLSLDRWDDEEDDDDTNTANAPKRPARPPAQTLLDYKQFEMVAHSMQMFEEYLIQTTGGTEMEKTAARQTRADDFDHHQAQRQQTSYQPRPRHRGGSYHPRDNTTSSYGPPSYRPQHLTYQPPAPAQRRHTQQQHQPPLRGPAQRQQQRPQQRHLEIPNNGGRAAYRPPPSYSPGRDRQPSPRLSPGGREGAGGSRRPRSGYSAWSDGGEQVGEDGGGEIGFGEEGGYEDEVEGGEYEDEVKGEVF